MPKIDFQYISMSEEEYNKLAGMVADRHNSFFWRAYATKIKDSIMTKVQKKLTAQIIEIYNYHEVRKMVDEKICEIINSDRQLIDKMIEKAIFEYISRYTYREMDKIIHKKQIKI